MGTARAVSFDFEKDGSLRQRVVNGTGLQLDVYYKKLNPKKD